ncbi:periplasmic protease [Bernardetia litoralis DSM 6794]|uniref:Periplasmic protease n=1 Tax=Bernardetia litoralis (strain ATCC 23117 / DSM 6794 / NBRC 15988 / NCIMB 1366 / Fx l1 / Sio-4) TaxID=880071 RepID=I4AJX5_BERLS|nr:S41 family peptidase [Bernardetia litoralis]AFM04260.1 periplasmic protease [Bernardetia litoralis DSM 6794]
MKNILFTIFALFLLSFSLFAQKSIDDSFSQKKMHKDLKLFRDIREKANSGLYKYRSKNEIDSIYNWAENEIKNSSTYRDFYNIIWKLTDFEGSLHNGLNLPKKVNASVKAEKTGYFPFPVKLIEGKLRMNMDSTQIPLGAEILSINNTPIEKVLPNLHKYYTTDGFNKTGKAIGINGSFSYYYRLHYGKQEQFLVAYKTSNEILTQTIQSVSYKKRRENFIKKRHSLSYDKNSYSDIEKNEFYYFEMLENDIAKLTLNTFAIGGNAQDPIHIRYTEFLDSVFTLLKEKKVNNLIVDIRDNGGGTDPNDLVTYSYLSSRNFMENTEAWISFRKIPYWKHIKGEIAFYKKPILKMLYNKELKKIFPLEKEGKYYEDSTSDDHQVRMPKQNAFTGKVYLMISPRVASAGSLFAAMSASEENTIVVGEETQGGYYGHNGHIPLNYTLSKSKLKMFFSIVNLEQDVPKKDNQPIGSGIMPDYEITQSYQDFIKNEDTQLNYVLEFIEKK